MKTLIRMICAAALVAVAATGIAKEAAPAAADPAIERRAMDLAGVLRCLVCQNQTIADSNADLAVDLRNQIREQMEAGKTNDQIIDFMVARYGDFVLYRPPFKTTTALLWAGPFVLLILAVVILLRYLVRRRRRVAEATLSEQERARAAALLAGTRERP
jgi:cytochrome c-type biogenesis protein CcmH